MKKFIAFITFTFVATAFSATTISFQCKSTPVPGVNEFSAKGIVTVDKLSNVEGVIDLKVKKMGEDSSLQIFEQISISGLVKHYNAGEVTNSAFDQLILTSSNAYLKSFNLLLDEGSALSSSILSIDNFLYRSNCERTDN